MQTSPISTELSARVHFDDLAREAEHHRVARRVLRSAKSAQPDHAVSALPVICIRRLTAMLRGARVTVFSWRWND